MLDRRRESDSIDGSLLTRSVLHTSYAKRSIITDRSHFKLSLIMMTKTAMTQHQHNIDENT